MFGTIARLKIKPGALPQLQALGAELLSGTRLRENGHIATYMYQGTDDPNEIWMVVMFESKEAYQKNADSPEQNEQFMQMSQFFAAPPEWHDGEVIWSADSRL
jgi:quinol monooxygenase YgiN